jgi:hypothetical protein
MNFEKAILFSIRHENQSILSAVHQRPDMKVKSAMGHFRTHAAQQDVLFDHLVSNGEHTC